MSWLAVKHAAKKTWTWLKTYWYVPALLVYTIIMAVVFRRSGSNAGEVLSITKDSYKKQVTAMNEIHETELKKRDEVLKEYNKVVDSIEKEHNKSVASLDRKKKKRIKELVEEHHGSPHTLSKMLAAKYGIMYVKED
ncbi:MAG: hypothetical protein CL398_01185 [Acidiferrobacteraceae bacterium]|nr:hypothetical protein [Acidiferrobacteraceae bacterium]|tara:strand:- start:353 stop:763 length:411 start_codon:yes stop_codon:yes gene_type:complete